MPVMPAAPNWLSLHPRKPNNSSRLWPPGHCGARGELGSSSMSPPPWLSSRSSAWDSGPCPQWRPSQIPQPRKTSATTTLDAVEAPAIPALPVVMPAAAAARHQPSQRHKQTVRTWRHVWPWQWKVGSVWSWSRADKGPKNLCYSATYWKAK